MTKIDGRSKKEAAKQLDQSLRRFKVDVIDLVQHHEVIRYEDPHRIFDDEGANAALVEARQAGKLRYIGFTGHKDPRIHLHMLQVAPPCRKPPRQRRAATSSHSRPHPYSTVPPRTRSGWERNRSACSC